MRTVMILWSAALLLALVGCSDSEDPRPETEPLDLTSDIPALQQKLDEKSGQFAESAPPEVIEAIRTGYDEIVALGLIDSALGVVDTIPRFGLTDANGEMVNISSVLSRGAVVLTFYRGNWCPYCNLQLQAYRDILPRIQALNGNLVAISPQIPDSSLSLAEREKLEYIVLSDLDNRVARSFGLSYRLPDAIADVFAGQIDLKTYNGNERNELPLTATYLVDRDGIIRWAFVEYDHRKRAEPADIVRALQALYHK